MIIGSLNTFNVKGCKQEETKKKNKYLNIIRGTTISSNYSYKCDKSTMFFSTILHLEKSQKFLLHHVGIFLYFAIGYKIVLIMQ